MVEKLWFLIPELILFAGAVVLATMGLSPRRALRDALPLVTVAFLVAAFIATPLLYDSDRIAEAQIHMPLLGKYARMMICAIGVLLTLVSVGLVDRRMESDVSAGRLSFDPLRASRGEFYAFFMLSLIGVMLCCSANDLIWLFLALELTSLPTYIMVAISRPSRRAQEAAVKYFFLGAMAAAVFLFGFALLYGATGTISLSEMREVFARQRFSPEGMDLVGTVGMLLAILGIGYKLAAAPMHFYAADVYEGAASPVTAFLGFVPKTAGAIALILLLSTVGWEVQGLSDAEQGLPREIVTTLWMVAVLTMTLGNIGALLQRSIKRMLAYSSIAHSGYLMIGIIAGPKLGLSAVLFYLLVYGIMNTGAFAVLSGLERQGHEVDALDDVAGLRQRHPAMAWSLALCAGSLLGFPPLLGFLAKLYVFLAGVESGQIALVVIAGLNSAISAYYYLKLVGIPILARPSARSETVVGFAVPWPRVVAVLSAVAVVVVPVFTGPLLSAPDTRLQDELPAASGASASEQVKRPVGS